MKITYIYHSCFLVETEHFLFLIDYYRGKLPKLDTKKTLCILSSHAHEDHFSKDIFEIGALHPNVYFILSNDISRKKVPGEFIEKTAFVGPHKTVRLFFSQSQMNSANAIQSENTIRPMEIQESDQSPESLQKIEIRTLKSTDEGVAFLIFADQKVIYHAGDLNDWYWEGEPQDWNDRMGEDYMAEIDRLAEWTRNGIDAAFVTLDGRQGKDFGKGMDYFLEHISAKSVFPMHFWEKYRTIHDYKGLPQARKYEKVIIEISKQGEVFEFEEL